MILVKMMKLMKKLLMKRNKVLMKGAIAQLGERYTGSVEVSGSNPLSSTIYIYIVDLFILIISLKIEKNNPEIKGYIYANSWFF